MNFSQLYVLATLATRNSNGPLFVPWAFVQHETDIVAAVASNSGVVCCKWVGEGTAATTTTINFPLEWCK